SLKPVLSNNLDLGLEWYFAPKAMLSASVFALDMKSYVTYGSYVANFYNQAANAVTPYNMSAAVNTTAEVRGLELAYAQALAGGFGVNANYTYADGKETGKVPGSACASTGNCRMLGNSKNVYNLGAYYEDDRFNVRVAYSYRSDFLNGLNRNSAIVQTGVGTVSAALGYKISNQWQLSLEGKDLNDPVLKSYASSPDQPRAFYKNGRQFYLSLRATM
ncbi:MAG: TonB-dependent receptor, partial [Aquabacterium sp.]|nr:TonB-dependent receptor [Aquabacterium sp.]